MRFRSFFGKLERRGLFRFVFVLEVAALYHCPFNPASMPLLLIIIHTNQKNLTVVILQAVQIVFSLDLFDCLFCGMSPLQFDNHGWKVSISIRLKYNVCETLSSMHFSMQGVVFLSRVICKRNHTGQSIFIVVFQNRCVCLMCLFD